MTNIKEQLLTFDTVDEIIEVRRECKSRNGSVYVIKLWSEVGIYEFKNEMNEIDDLKNYIILTQIPGFEDEYEYIGIVDGVRDLTDWAFRNLDFPKGTKMSTISIGCDKIVEDIKELYASIRYNEWIEYEPSSEQILDRINNVTDLYKENESCNESEESYNKCLDMLQNKLLAYGYTKLDGKNNITGTYELKGKNGKTILVKLGTIDGNSVLIQLKDQNEQLLMQTSYDCNDIGKIQKTIFDKYWIATIINDLGDIQKKLVKLGFLYGIDGKPMVFDKKINNSLIIVNLKELWKGTISIIVMSNNEIIEQETFYDWKDAEQFINNKMSI